jgi:serine/threonine protein kinase
VVLYEMATGAKPFKGDSAAVVFAAILNSSPVAPACVNPEVPPELERIILKALEKDRAGRYQSAADLLVDLKTLSKRTKPGLVSAVHGPKPRSRKALAAVVLVLAVAAGGVWNWRQRAGIARESALKEAARLFDAG